MVRVPGARGLSLCTLLLLCFGSRTPGAGSGEPAPSLLFLLFFFLSTTEELEGIINGGRVKG
jgi:hypothetical protein